MERNFKIFLVLFLVFVLLLDYYNSQKRRDRAEAEAFAEKLFCQHKAEQLAAQALRQAAAEEIPAPRRLPPLRWQHAVLGMSVGRACPILLTLCGAVNELGEGSTVERFLSMEWAEDILR